MKNQQKSKTRKQKIYKMRGCSKNKKYSQILSRKKYGGKVVALNSTLGGDLNLAYPYTGPVAPNTALAYTGKGGKNNGVESLLQPSYLQVETSNVNGKNPLYPNTGPLPNGFNFLNPLNQQRGGNCGCGGMPLMNGGASHRKGCKCSTCKMKSSAWRQYVNMNGGGGCSTSNNGIPYPDGLVGKPYVNPTNLPGANGIPGDANYYSLNTYNNDVSRQMIDVGANKPFLGFMNFKGGAKKTMKRRGGGGLSNTLGQDLINLGRQFTHGLGNVYNTLNGNPTSPSPLPWKGQLSNTINMDTLKNI